MFAHAVRTEMFILSRCAASGYIRSGLQQGVRTLFSQAALGIENYVKTRERVQTQFLSMAEKFRNKMSEYAEDSSKNMIFTEDLKNMLHIVESTDEDMDLIMRMMKRFSQQNKQVRFGSFIFGPVVMRMFHYLNKADIALEAFKDPELDGFFDQLNSFQILLDLLYRNGRYDDLLDVFEVIKEKQLQGTKYPKNSVVLAVAACYKKNTPESYKYSMDLWKDLLEVGHIPMRRTVTFVAGLAINQNDPHSALEIISAARQQNYVSVRNLKIAALADLGRPEDALPILRTSLEVDMPEQRKQSVFQDVLDKVRAAVETLNNKEATREFERIEQGLLEMQQVNIEETLDAHLCSEISAVNFLLPRRNQTMLAASFNQDRPRGPQQTFQSERGQFRPERGQFRPERAQFRQFQRRPGLHELE